MESFERIKCKSCKENYGAENRGWLCSVCFKNKKDTDIQHIENKLDSTIKESENKAKEEVKKEPEGDPNFPAQTNTMNCWKCDRKVGHLGFKCDCNYIFCKSHRHFSDHDCPYDYKLKKNVFKGEIKQEIKQS